MATVRPKDLSKTASSVANDDYLVLGGSTNGTRKIARGDFRSDLATALRGDPTTYKLTPLNGSNKIDATYLPTSNDTPKGDWDADNSTLGELNDGTGTAGDYYDITDANGGTLNQGSGTLSINGASVSVGDIIKYNGTLWYIVPGVSNVLNGSATAAAARTVLEVNSVDEDAEATGTKLAGPSVRFDGSNDYVEVGDDSKLSFTDGTDDSPFSVEGWLKFNDATSGVISGKFGAGASAREWYFYTDSSDLLTFAVVDTSGNREAVYATTALTAYEGDWIHVAATYGGSGANSASAFTAAADEMSIYINGESVPVTENSSGTYTGMSDTTEPLSIGRRNSADYFDGEMRTLRIHNRELSASDVKDAKNGSLGFSDEWGGSFASVENSDFSAGTDSWSAGNGTATGNIDAIGGVDDTLRLTIDTTSNSHSLFQGSLLTAGKRYRIEFDLYVPSANTALDGIVVQIGTSGTVTVGSSTPTADTWTRFSAEAVASASGNPDRVLIYAADGGVTGFTDGGAGTDVMYIKDVHITPIGIVADFRGESFDEDTSAWLDSSGNSFTGSASGAALVGRPHPHYYSTPFTPSIEFGGAATGLAATSYGLATRIGRTAHVEGRILLSAKGSSTGTAKITGLPFNGEDLTVATCGLIVNYAANMASLNSMPTLLVDDAGTEATVYHLDNAAGSGTGSTAATDANFTNTTDIRFSGTYTL